MDNWSQQGDFKKKTLIVTGSELEYIYKMGQENNFIKIAVAFKATIICRCSPQQKSDVTALLRIKKKKIVCAVGDGGNDVAMIQ